MAWRKELGCPDWIKQGQDIRIPLSIKLDNINIKRMIESTFITINCLQQTRLA